MFGFGGGGNSNNVFQQIAQGVGEGASQAGDALVHGVGVGAIARGDAAGAGKASRHRDHDS
jgi:hypothetical protein